MTGMQAPRLRTEAVRHFPAGSPRSWIRGLATGLALTAILSASSFGQGMLPKKKGADTETPRPVPYLLIGDAVPASLTVVDAAGTHRPLLSYKTANDILVVGFFSPRCPFNQGLWKRLKRLYDNYKGWHVSFLGVSVNKEETLEELAAAMKAAGLPYPAVRDPDQRVARALHITATPEIVVINEWGTLKYRGALDAAVKDPQAIRPKGWAAEAIEAVVGHIEEPAHPEPPDFIGCPVQ